MPIVQVQSVEKSRLIQELKHVGLDIHGSRSELIQRLNNHGIFNINTSCHAGSEKNMEYFVKKETDSVLLGSGAYKNECKNKLIIRNSYGDEPLIEGDFERRALRLPELIKIKESDLCADTCGEEGDIRMKGGLLYIYRCNGVHAGWYQILLGSVLIV